MADRIRQRGVIHLGARVDGIETTEGRAVTLRVDGRRSEHSKVISSLPLQTLVPLLPRVPAPVTSAVARLQARSSVVVHLRVRGLPRSPYLWVYVADPALRVGRISDHRSWNPELTGDDDAVVAMEFWCNDDELRQCADDWWIEQASAELRALRLSRSAVIVDGRVTRARGALPIPACGYEAPLAVVRQYARELGIETIGRHGAFSTGSMADVMAEGMMAADRALLDRPRASTLRESTRG
jgi:protoporphyrinogen oxidase